jgi:hypothetical protein
VVLGQYFVYEKRVRQALHRGDGNTVLSQKLNPEKQFLPTVLTSHGSKMKIKKRYVIAVVGSCLFALTFYFVLGAAKVIRAMAVQILGIQADILVLQMEVEGMRKSASRGFDYNAFMKSYIKNTRAEEERKKAKK